jgi:hypothetical protein
MEHTGCHQLIERERQRERQRERMDDKSKKYREEEGEQNNVVKSANPTSKKVSRPLLASVRNARLFLLPVV